MEVALELNNISKDFGATRALDGVDFTVRHGEVHALLGENGSGKSTLIKVLAGIHDPEPGGTLTIEGSDIPLPLPTGAFHQYGLSFVHQDLGLARPLSVLENLVGGSSASDASRWRVHWRAEAAKARALLHSYGVDIDPRTIVNDLPPVGQALVAIARAAEELRQYRIRTGATSSVLVLDEPTVFLPQEELSFLFDLIRTVVSSGSSVIFISHDLPAVRTIADRVTVLRDGRVVATASMTDVSDDQIVEYIVGPVKSRELSDSGAGPPRSARVLDRSQAGMRVSGLQGGRLKSFDLAVDRGETVGIAGLLGSGAEDVPYLLFGAVKAIGGTVTMRDHTVHLAKQHPAAAVQMGMSFIPADRQRDGIAGEIEVDRNMMLLVVDRFLRSARLRNRDLRSTADQRADEFDIRPRRTGAQVGTLSGGNAQKVVVAKWLETKPDVLLLHEPTQGVDIAARSQIYGTLAAAADAGTSVVWVSSDFDELAATCDRIVVLGNGQQMSEIHGTDITPEAITAAVFASAAATDDGIDRDIDDSTDATPPYQHRLDT